MGPVYRLDGRGTARPATVCRSAARADLTMETVTAPRVLVVPGAAVRSYVRPVLRELRERGFDAELLAAPGAPGSPADLVGYGTALGGRLRTDPAPVDLLVGLSVGAQAAAVAAAATVVPDAAAAEGDAVGAPPQVRRVLLVGPTV